MMGYKIGLAIQTQYRRVTDTQQQRRPRVRIASRGQKGNKMGQMAIEAL